MDKQMLRTTITQLRQIALFAVGGIFINRLREQSKRYEVRG